MENSIILKELQFKDNSRNADNRFVIVKIRLFDHLNNRVTLVTYKNGSEISKLGNLTHKSGLTIFNERVQNLL